MTISRRKIIRDSMFGAGALTLSPILGQLHAQAAGKKLPPRFVFVVEGNGAVVRARAVSPAPAIKLTWLNGRAAAS